jgi:hypothetical protein
MSRGRLSYTTSGDTINILASVQSIVAQTLRATPSTTHARTAITSRIMAHSRAHDVLTQERWTGADLRAIIDAMFQPLEQQASGRLEISGPKNKADNDSGAVTFLRAERTGDKRCHTRLAVERCRSVRVSWTVSGADDDANHLNWCENGGPSPFLPGSAGSGNRVILRAMPSELGRKASATYDTPVLVFTSRCHWRTLKKNHNPKHPHVTEEARPYVSGPCNNVSVIELQQVGYGKDVLVTAAAKIYDYDLIRIHPRRGLHDLRDGVRRLQRGDYAFLGR